MGGSAKVVVGGTVNEDVGLIVRSYMKSALIRDDTLFSAAYIVRPHPISLDSSHSRGAVPSFNRVHRHMRQL